jgi:hypothetical protein
MIRGASGGLAQAMAAEISRIRPMRGKLVFILNETNNRGKSLTV